MGDDRGGYRDRAFGGADVDELEEVELQRMQRYHNVLETAKEPLPSARLKSIGEFAARRFDAIPLECDRHRLVLDLVSSAAEAPPALFAEVRDRDLVVVETVRWRPPAIVLVDTTYTEAAGET